MDDIDTCDEYDLSVVPTSAITTKHKYVDDVDSLLNCIKIWEKERVGYKTNDVNKSENKVEGKTIDLFDGLNHIIDNSVDDKKTNTDKTTSACEEDEENEVNPILLINNNPPIITEKDILTYGRHDSFPEKLENVELLPNLIQDVTVNCQIDQILGNKVEQENNNTIEEEANDNKTEATATEPIPDKIRGVCFCRSDNSWTAWWTEKGRSRKKAFKLSVYGFEEARRRAIEHRLQVEELMPELREKRNKSHRKRTEVKSPVIHNNVNNYSTRSKSFSHFYRTKPADSRGIYYKDENWYATWTDDTGKRNIKAFPITTEQTFLAARSAALETVKQPNTQNLAEEATKRRKTDKEDQFVVLSPTCSTNTNKILLEEIGLDDNVINGIEKAININGDQNNEKTEDSINTGETKVNAFCLSQVKFGNKSSLHILPTLVKGPGDSNVLTVVVVNTNQQI